MDSEPDPGPDLDHDSAITVTHPAFGLGPRLGLLVGGLGLAVTASQGRNQTESGV